RAAGASRGEDEALTCPVRRKTSPKSGDAGLSSGQSYQSTELPSRHTRPSRRMREGTRSAEDNFLAAILALKKREAESPERNNETAMIAQQLL
ncbi:MAG: hypothetical protein AB7S97_02490, partial [Thermoplasmata archaeon]